MSTAIAPLPTEIERVLIGGDLAQLKPEQRLSYYNHLCESLGLNPLTKPFQYLTLSGKTVLYATKDCTEQLRNLKGVSVRIMAREVVEGCYVVTAQASLPSGRCDESIGAVPIELLKGEARSNAMMKCETKAKRRVTLSICGLGMLDESEVDSIPGAMPFDGGSKEAQQDVAQRRIAEERAKTVSVISTPPATIIELADSLDEPASGGAEPPGGWQGAVGRDGGYEKRETAKRDEAREALEHNASGKPPIIRKKGDISFNALKEIGTLKNVIRGITGSDDKYYEVLKSAGVEHADELSLVAGRQVYKTLLKVPNALKQDEALLLEVQTHALRIGGIATQAALGRAGLSSIEDVLKMPNGTELDALLRELRTTV